MPVPVSIPGNEMGEQRVIIDDIEFGVVYDFNPDTGEVTEVMRLGEKDVITDEFIEKVIYGVLVTSDYTEDLDDGMIAELIDEMLAHINKRTVPYYRISQR